MNKNKICQCLFDFKSFFSEKSHLLFPGTLCFPEYFSFAITSTFINLSEAIKNEDKDLQNLCYGYLNYLPVIVKRLYQHRYEIEVSIDKLMKTSKEIMKENDEVVEYNLLETYLKDEKSVKSYRKALLESALDHHNFDNKKQLVDHLCHWKCCNAIKEEDEEDGGGDGEGDAVYPSSDRYLLYNANQRNNANLSHLKHINGPKFWGPYYWNVFHSIVENECENNDEKKALVDFIFVVPVTLPCEACMLNYINHVPTFQLYIEEYRMSESKCLKTLYEKIHKKINYQTWLT